MEKKPEHPAKNSRMILRLRRSKALPGKASRVWLLEPRKDHFRKTLFLAGALSAVAIFVFLFTYTNSVQPHKNLDESAASAQSAQQ